MSKIVIDQIENSLPDYFEGLTFSKLAVLVDENTRRDCLPIISELIPIDLIIEIASGEANKTLTTCSRIWQALTDAEFDRHSILINLGGGVIGDMGGFCASTYKRGISFINIPTTLLASVDASVGGKLGIDFNGFKNHIGLFREPEAVLVDDIFLQTLPKEELRSGFAEVLKHGLIADIDYFKQVSSQGLDHENWKPIIAHSIHIKNEVVKSDPSEAGLRKVLNFGHTVGHALESHFLGTSNHLLHGEAIAIGMICEAYLSLKMLGLSKHNLDEITSSLVSNFGKVKINRKELPDIVKHTYQDKKNLNGNLNFSLLKSIGEATFDIQVNENDVIDSLFYYLQIAD